MFGSVRRRLAVVGAVAALVGGAALAPAPVAAAPTPPGPSTDRGAPHQPPGKGDSDGDGIADDLAAALADATPGQRLGVIVQGIGPAAARRAASSLVVGHRYSTIPAFSGSLVAGQVKALARVPGVARVELDGVAHALDASGDLDYGVTAARAAGIAPDGTLDGDGVGICVIDTGVDPNHEQLVGTVDGWRDWVGGRTAPYDDHGHGTHVSSIAAGSGAGHPEFGGVARGARIIAAKVLASNGSGADSDVVAAIEWCAGQSQVRVISMSLGSPGSDGSDAGSQAADAAAAAGKVVVVAAGNSGDAPGTISSPGVASDVVTVGAASDPSALAGASDTDAGLYLAGFSSRGPTSNPDAPLKPDVVGPGLSVVAARAGTTAGYVAYSGTSMATPFVAGVVALGIEVAPTASPAQLKDALRASAQDAGTAGADPEWGHGLVDARAFVAALAGSAPGSAPWPGHELVHGSVGAGSTVDVPLQVSAAGSPLGVTLRTVDGSSTCALPVGGACWFGYEWAPDLDIYLLDPAGRQVAMSRCMLESSNGNCGAPGRFETIGIPNAAAGTWTLRVESFTGAGQYQADVFGALGTAPPPPPPPEPPSAPTGLTASATSPGAVELAWTDTSADEDGFTVARCTGAGCSDFATVAQVGADVTAWTDSGVVAGTTYRYRVRAVRGTLTSAWSAVASATTPTVLAAPPAPTNLRATEVSTSRVALAWDASVRADGYRVHRCEGRRCSAFVQQAVVPGGTTVWSDTTVAARSTYSYYVTAYNAAGDTPSSPITVKTPRR